MNDRVLIVAEAGVNHNGDVGVAKQLIDVAREAGADAVKFQTFVSEENVSVHSQLADYQTQNMGAIEGGQLDMLRALELSKEQFRELKEYCDQGGIEFISTPDDEGSVDLLVELGVRCIKIASAEITNLPFLKMVARRGVPMMLSTGMSTLGEVDAAMQAIYSVGHSDVTMLHCTSNYPCELTEVNLRAMVTLRDAFGVPVGYSDHTLGTDVAVAAVALGASVIEKHFTLDKDMPGPDHRASLDPDELARLVTHVRNAEIFLGDGIKRPAPSEQGNRLAMRRSLVAAKALQQGDTVNEAALISKRPGTGISPQFLDIVVGMRVNRDIAEDEVLHWKDLT